MNLPPLNRVSIYVPPEYSEEMNTLVIWARQNPDATAQLPPVLNYKCPLLARRLFEMALEEERYDTAGISQSDRPYPFRGFVGSKSGRALFAKIMLGTLRTAALEQYPEDFSNRAEQIQCSVLLLMLETAEIRIPSRIINRTGFLAHTQKHLDAAPALSVVLLEKLRRDTIAFGISTGYIQVIQDNNPPHKPPAAPVPA